MTPFLYALLSVGIVSAVSLTGILALSFKEYALRRVIFVVVSIATGALFGDALFHLIPEAIEDVGSFTAPMLFVSFGILGFFVLEKFFHWHHHHTGLEANHPEEECPEMTHVHSPRNPLARLILTSDSIHNFLDGIVIAASYLISVELGIATTLAVILHEIPQEVGDFGVLLHAGLSKTRALFYNFLSALFAVLGAILFFSFPSIGSATPYVVAFAAGNFLYIAGSDLVPELHKTKEPLRSFAQFAGLIIGLAAMFLLLFLE